jgi:prepilin-type N-terminal cleavage/methylation domain-containing protein
VTLIELLVVIAIIGILASVVLASLNTARGKASNAAVKAGLSQARTQAEVWRDDNGGSYTGLCAGIANIITNVDSNSYAATTASCQVTSPTGANYALSARLKVLDGTYTYWCVDSTGVSKGTNAGASTPACP